MTKRPPTKYDDDDYPEANFLGMGQYQFTGAKPSVTKLKNPIGFVRPKPKVVTNRVKSKRK